MADEEPGCVVDDLPLSLVEQGLPLGNIGLLVRLLKQLVDLGRAVEGRVHAALVLAVKEHAEEVLGVAGIRLPSAERDVQRARAPDLAVLGPFGRLDLALDADRLEVLLDRLGELRALRVVAAGDGVRVQRDRLALIARVLEERLRLLRVVRVALQGAVEAP